MPQLLHAVAWVVVLAGALVVLALSTWLTVVALRSILRSIGWWRDFFAFAVARRRSRRVGGRPS